MTADAAPWRMAAEPDARTELAELRAAWTSLARDLGLRSPTEDLRDDLLRRWSEPRRAYHSTAHLAAVLRTLDELHAPESAPAEARAAAWFHDAVYDGAAGEDEERSARLAERSLTDTGLAPDRAGRVADMVRATAGHIDPSNETASVDGATAALLDADLAVLAAPAATYDAYAAGVRAEHADVDDAAFATGRARVLRTLLGRSVLFHTASARTRFEAAARANLTRELTALGDADRPTGATG